MFRLLCPFPSPTGGVCTYATNVLERLNKGVKRRTRVVEIFPNGETVIRLLGALLVEADEEW